MRRHVLSVEGCGIIVLDLLTRNVGPDEEGGGTFLSSQLHAILVMYTDRHREWKNSITQRRPRPEKPKMLNLIIITGGEADKESVEDVIVTTAGELDELRAHLTQMGIRFFQIGTDDHAAK
ncbi:hypothetical protein MMYC01_203950 [Madurella mycetomatis]|uniref:Uncharacterized protein n=1 Tax=Madurella mycetomatis TaxID=100816 RepID=A0A175WAH2_9PEZI|nr:hypothetical protein MMYC01_203950 [Madurella mycetomatis]